MGNRTETIRRRYDRVAAIYDLMESPMEKMGMGSWRQELIKRAQGRGLEVGVGTGKNIEFYPENVKFTGIDISPKMLARARLRAERLGVQVELMEMDAQNLQFPDATFDTVIATCVFCSVPDPVQGLREIARVCKPEGEILFLEHVRSQQWILGPMMDFLNPVTVGLWGANINRNTVANIIAAGMYIVEQRDLSHDIVKQIIASTHH